MFRLSRGHLQADVWNIWEGIKIPSARDLYTSHYISNVNLKMTPQGVETRSWLIYYFHEVVFLMVVNLFLLG